MDDLLTTGRPGTPPKAPGSPDVQPQEGGQVRTGSEDHQFPEHVSRQGDLDPGTGPVAQ